MNQDLKRTLWAAADKLRSSMDAAEYKHIVLGLIFLKYISDAFDERREVLEAAFADETHDFYLPDADDRALAAEDRDYYTAANVFWVPGQARWETIRANAKQADIGTRIDLALDAIEADNPRLKGILDKRFGRAQLEPGKLGELIDLISTIGFTSANGHHAKDLLGEVYEYFLGQFASAEGKKGGQFYTPASVVKVLVEVLAPHKGKVYDPCCGSGGMFVQSEKFIESHGGKFGDISIYGQEANPTTWRLVAMNLAIRGMDFNLGKEPADTFHRDQHADLRADYVLANPPFNISDWGGERLLEDKRWVHGTPPTGNANYAWLQHILFHLGPLLGALDDRIDLLRQTNATLESIAQALFKSWFIDFDPVRAKAEGREPEGMDAATAALFPAEFEESALGVIPKGWRVAAMRDVVADVYDGPHATPPEASEGPVFLGIKNLTGTSLDLGEVRHISESDWAQWTRRVTPQPDDIVFSYEAALGLFALIPPGLTCCLGRRLALIRPMAEDGTPHFWFQQFIGEPFQRLLDKHTVHGATVNRIPLKEFPSFTVMDPGNRLRIAFESVAQPLWVRIHANRQQALNLAKTRDTLLPRLISGKLSLPEARAQIEDAVTT